MRSLTATLAFLAAAAGAARADEVVLRNGARFEGEVKESGNSVIVKMDFGTITFRKMDVARIERGHSALQEFDAALEKLKDGDLDGRFQLGLWAQKKGLANRAQQVFEHILARDPNHAGAREALGHRKLDGQWLTEDEYKTAIGLVYFRGDWMRREVVDEIRRIEAEQAAIAARELELEALRIRAAEAEAAVLREQQAQYDAAYEDYYYNRPVVIWGGGWGGRPIQGPGCRPRRPCDVPRPVHPTPHVMPQSWIPRRTR
jgi:hypothetical protein